MTMKITFFKSLYWAFLPLAIFILSSCGNTAKYEGEFVYYTFSVGSDNQPSEGLHWKVTEIGDTLPLFYLGEFEDIQSFSWTAQESLSRSRDGKITYWIAPTTDLKGYSVIEILRFNSCLPVGDIFVGPIVYKQGWQQLELGDAGEKGIKSDWQPEAKYHKIDLTPKAKMKFNKLLSLLHKGEITRKNDSYYFPDDRKLTEDEFHDAVDFGILVPKN